MATPKEGTLAYQMAELEKQRAALVEELKNPNYIDQETIIFEEKILAIDMQLEDARKDPLGYMAWAVGVYNNVVQDKVNRFPQ